MIPETGRSKGTEGPRRREDQTVYPRPPLRHPTGVTDDARDLDLGTSVLDTP